VWLEGNINPTRTISVNIDYSMSLFVTSVGDIYIDNGNYYGLVDKWSINTTSIAPAMYVTQSCSGLFVDINNTLYCSLANLNQVVTKSLDDSSNTLRIVVGTGCAGLAPDMLYSPNGIFVDINFNLYVSDSSNNRIQLFQSGQLNATTRAGYGAPGTITLFYPTSVVLDVDGYLFIVDRNNHRIIGSGPNGFQCVLGCSGASGSASNQLYYPQTMAFDSYGNIFVADTNNGRIQKFVLATNSCGMYHYVL
jgi:sugar lactone lactonase YvrE